MAHHLSAYVEFFTLKVNPSEGELARMGEWLPESWPIPAPFTGQERLMLRPPMKQSLGN